MRYSGEHTLMASTEPQQLPNYIYRAMDALSKLTHFARTATLGFHVTAGLPQLLTIVVPDLAEIKEDTSVQAFLGEADMAAPRAAEHVNSGFAYLYSLLAVRLATILEGGVNDAVVESLLREDINHRSEILELDGPLVSFADASPEDRALLLAGRLAHIQKAALRAGIGKFEAILKPVGLDGGVDDDLRRALLELLNVRNVIVHKNGIADQSFVSACPWLSVPVGMHVNVTHDAFLRYSNAILLYLAEITGRWLIRDGKVSDEAVARLKERLVQSLPLT